MSETRPIRLTDQAEADLAEIWSYIAEEASEAIATRFVHAIHASFQRLSDFPLSGSARDYLGVGLRSVVHDSYVSYYRVVDDSVVIVRVMHGARDIATIAEQGGLI